MTAKKKTAKKKTAPVRKARKPKFEGRQAMIPGVAPKKPAKAAETYTVPQLDGLPRTIPMPPLPEAHHHVYRRSSGSAGGHGAVVYSKRLELRVMPEQLTAWDRCAMHERMTLAEWMRTRLDAGVELAAFDSHARVST